MLGRAETLQLYDTNVLFANGDHLTGTITYDPSPATIGLVTGDLLLTNGSSVISVIQQTTVYATTLASAGGPPVQQELFFFASGFSLNLVIPTPALLGYTGGPVCLVTDPCLLNEYTAEEYYTGYYTDPIFLPATSGSLTLETSSSPAPEPATLTLVGAGLASLLAARSRRRARAV